MLHLSRTLRCSSRSLHTKLKATRSSIGLLHPLKNTTYSVRTYYGHISDDKMAPQLEPYFKKCARLLLSQ
jgi:hypothetical protein